MKCELAILFFFNFKNKSSKVCLTVQNCKANGIKRICLGEDFNSYILFKSLKLSDFPFVTLFPFCKVFRKVSLDKSKDNLKTVSRGF